MLPANSARSPNTSEAFAFVSRFLDTSQRHSQCVRRLQSQKFPFCSRVLSLCYQPEQALGLLSGRLRRPGRSMRANSKEALATECAKFDDVHGRTTLTSGAKSPDSFLVAGIPNRFTDAERLHPPDSNTQICHWLPWLLATT